MTIDQILTGNVDLDAQACEELRQFARDYAWEGPIEDPVFAADTVMAELMADHTCSNQRACEMLRSELKDSARRA